VIEEPARVRLDFESHPENVALVRAALSGLGAAAKLDEELTADLKTAVSEACNNVVLHAYPGGTGPLCAQIEAYQAGIAVTVTDKGGGITRISGGPDRMGLGLALISALADKAEFVTPEEGGTQVRMWFARQTSIREHRDGSASPPWPHGNGRELEGDLIVWCAPVELVRFVIGRLTRLLAASSPARFSMTRVADLHAVSDAMAAYVELAADGQFGMALSSSPHRLVIDGGPLWLDSRGGLPRAPQDELERRRIELAKMVDTLSTVPFNDGKLVHLELVDARDRS
jgi:serine/threonine-protein kinase RsbW